MRRSTVAQEVNYGDSKRSEAKKSGLNLATLVSSSNPVSQVLW